LGHADEAISALERSIELGYADPEHLETDADLASLRAVERFQALVRRLREAPPAS
jgi:hypothetical protein